MKDFRSEIEEVKSKAGIVEVVSEYVALRKAGRNFVGLCPFHKEKTPSFSVNAEKQIFYCFGCGAGGDVFEFLIKINNMSFQEALTHLADKTGVVLREKNTEHSGAEKKLRDEINRINRLAGEYFARNLAAESGKRAREYLRKRGISDSTVNDFHLGLALNGWRHLRDYFEKSGVPLPLVEKAGLIIRGEKGDFYDRFRGRLIFPIESVTGDTIAFGGRGAGDEKPKYLNSPESPVYTKGRNLYALNRARDDIRRKDAIIIVEGYFDALSLWNAGVRNVAATLGTALTREHLGLIRRFTSNIVAIFDPDEGGRTALERALSLFLEENFNARAVILPENLDPDEYVKKYGAGALESLIAGSQSLVDYYIESVIGSKGGFEAAQATMSKAIPFLSRIEDPRQRNLFVKRVSELLNVEEGLLRAEVEQAISGRGKRPDSGQAGIGPAETGERRPSRADQNIPPDPVEMTLIRLLAEHPDRIPADFDQGIFDCFLDPELKRLGRELAGNGRKEPDLSGLLKHVENKAVREKILQWSVSQESPFGAELIGQVLADTVEKIRMKWTKVRIGALRRDLRKAQEKGDAELWKRILVEIEQLRKGTD